MKKATVTIESMYTAQQALRQLEGVKFTARTAYWLGRNTDTIDMEVKMANKKRDDLIKEYGTVDAQGNVVVLNFIDKLDDAGKPIDMGEGRTEKIRNPVVDIFNKEWESILNTEVEIEFAPITMDMLVNNKGENIDMSPNQFKGISFLFDDSSL
jgi:hypothetical protein